MLTLHRIPNGDLIGRIFEDNAYGTITDESYVTIHRTVPDNFTLNEIRATTTSTTQKIMIFAVAVGSYGIGETNVPLIVTDNDAEIGTLQPTISSSPGNGLLTLVLDPTTEGSHDYKISSGPLEVPEARIQASHLRIVILDIDGTSQESSG